MLIRRASQTTEQNVWRIEEWMLVPQMCQDIDRQGRQVVRDIKKISAMLVRRASCTIELDIWRIEEWALVPQTGTDAKASTSHESIYFNLHSLIPVDAQFNH